jgi:uncharacterized protein (UPF0332 family)
VPSTKDEYIKKVVGKAEHNRGFARFIHSATDDYPDWIVVCAFYSALHFVEAFLASKDYPRARSHSERLRYLQSADPADEFGGIYFRLQQHGYNARYNCDFDAGKWLNHALSDLGRIRSSVMKHLQDAGFES